MLKQSMWIILMMEFVYIGMLIYYEFIVYKKLNINKSQTWIPVVKP